MGPMYYIGLDVHKQEISYCVNEGGGKVFAEGWIPATRCDLDRWMNTLPEPWRSPIHSLKPNSASSRSNQPEYPAASIPTRTQIPRCFSSRVAWSALAEKR